MIPIQHSFWHRNGQLPAFRMLIFSLFLLMMNISAISLTIARLQDALTWQAAEFLGGDLKLSSPTPLPPYFEDKAHQLGLSTTHVVEFFSMLGHGENAVLSEIKAVGDHYPLIGNMQVFTTDPKKITIRRHGPEPGKIWLEPRLLNQLQVSVGDTLMLGKQSVEIQYLIHVEPDKINSGFFSPRAMIAQANLPDTGLIQPGSRAQYNLLISGQAENCLAFSTAIQPELQPNQILVNATKHKSVAQRIIDNSSIYIYFSGFINLILAGIALYFSVKHYLKTQIPWVAFLKCTGISPKTLTQWYLFGFSLFGGSGLLIGLVCGWGLSEWGLITLKNYLPQMILRDVPWTNACLSFCIVGALFLGFIFPFIRHLSQTPAIQVMNRQISNPEFDFTYYTLGLGFLFLVPFLFKGQSEALIAMTLGFVSITAISLSFFYGLLNILSRISKKFSPRYRYMCAQLTYHRTESAVQLLIFTLLLSIIMTLYDVKTQLLSQWFEDLPEKTPNYFLINISQETQQALQDYGTKMALPINRLYPVVRGRLFKVNGTDLLDRYSYSEKQGLNRLWNLTFTDILPPKNRLLQGKWFDNASVQPEVSLEADIAKSLGLKLGDILSFQIDQQIIQAKLSSIRAVSWQTFQPNFFAIFPENLGKDFIKSYITSLYIAPEKPEQLKQLSHTFPGLYVIDINMLLSQMKKLYGQIGALISGLFLYSFVFSVLIFLSITRENASEKIRNNALLHTIGITDWSIRLFNFGEYSLVGLLSGLTALVVSVFASNGLLQHIFHVSYQFNPSIMLSALLFPPLLGILGQQPLRKFMWKNSQETS